MKNIEDVIKDIKIAPSTYQELINIALRRALKSEAGKLKSNLRRAEILKIRRITDYVSSYMRDIALKSPFLKELHPFYRELISLMINRDEYRMCLSRIYKASIIVRKISSEEIRRISKAKGNREILTYRRSFIGRVSSVLRKLDKCFKIIRRYQLEMLKLPSIRTDVPSIIVTGAPNVGKSSLLRVLTKAKPEIKPYPFTTKNIIVGHLETGSIPIQIIDTPGLLDRPLEEKGKIELRAIVALKHLKGAIMFVYDPSETCGFPLEYQHKIYQSICKWFPNTPKLIVGNKFDLLNEDSISNFLKVTGFNREKIICVSAISGENINLLKDRVANLIKNTN